MAKIWRVVLFVALAMLVLGILTGGAGLLTGASVQRAWEGLALQQRFDELMASLRNIPFLR